MRTYRMPIKKNTDVRGRAHSCGVHTVMPLPLVWKLACPLAFWGVVVNCLEETWEERGYREKRKEGGRAQ